MATLASARIRKGTSLGGRGATFLTRAGKGGDFVKYKLFKKSDLKKMLSAFKAAKGGSIKIDLPDVTVTLPRGDALARIWAPLQQRKSINMLKTLSNDFEPFARWMSRLIDVEDTVVTYPEGDAAKRLKGHRKYHLPSDTVIKNLLAQVVREAIAVEGRIKFSHRQKR